MLRSIPQLLPRRGREARARRTQKFRPLRSVSRLDKLHRSARRRVALFHPPHGADKPDTQLGYRGARTGGDYNRFRQHFPAFRTRSFSRGRARPAPPGERYAPRIATDLRSRKRPSATISFSTRRMTATVEASNFSFKLFIVRNLNRWARHRPLLQRHDEVSEAR